MALKIRLRQQGRTNRQVYRLVVTDSRSPRDGKYIEMLGWYNPFEAEAERNCQVEAERIQYWLSQGAQLTEKAEALIHRIAPTVTESKKQKDVAKQAKVKAQRQRRRSKQKAVA
jgi:small subunit ribosomal protein S16